MSRAGHTWDGPLTTAGGASACKCRRAGIGPAVTLAGRQSGEKGGDYSEAKGLDYVVSSTTISCVSRVGMEERAGLRPMLKWAGGKRWLLSRLGELWKGHEKRRFVEPFCGGLAVALGLRPKKALLNDVNPHIINFYTWVQKGLRLDIEMRNDERHYYNHRESFNELVGNGRAGSRETAQLFYYLNRTGYNGLCRFNRKGEFNVPFGSYKRINYAKDFLNHKHALAGWKFQAADFELVKLSKGDFIYADPPYDVEFRQYAKGGFVWEEQERLAEWLARHGGPVVASNQKTTRIVRLYRKLGFSLKYLDGPRKISCKGDRTPAREMLATKGL